MSSKHWFVCLEFILILSSSQSYGNTTRDDDDDDNVVKPSLILVIKSEMTVFLRVRYDFIPKPIL